MALAHSVYIVAKNRPDIVSLSHTKGLPSLLLGDNQWPWNRSPSMLCAFRFVEVAPVEYLCQDLVH